MNFDDQLELFCQKIEIRRTYSKIVPLLVNLYELKPSLSFTKNLGIGIFHSATEFFGFEVAFGGHSSGSQTGVFVTYPMMIPAPAKFYKQIKLADIQKTPQEIAEIVRNASKKFRGNEYHLMHNNCNHFTQYLVKLLTGEDLLPEWVNRAAAYGAKLGCGGCGDIDPNVGPETGRFDRENSSY